MGVALVLPIVHYRQMKGGHRRRSRLRFVRSQRAVNEILLFGACDPGGCVSRQLYNRTCKGWA